MLRVQTTKLFKATSGARLEPLQSHANRMLDGGVVTHIEMQKGMFLETAPIPAVHRSVIAHVECPRNYFAVTFGKHEAEVRGETALQVVKKLSRQILPAIIKSVHMPFVQAVSYTHLRAHETPE